MSTAKSRRTFNKEWVGTKFTFRFLCDLHGFKSETHVVVPNRDAEHIRDINKQETYPTNRIPFDKVVSRMNALEKFIPVPFFMIGIASKSWIKLVKSQVTQLCHSKFNAPFEHCHLLGNVKTCSRIVKCDHIGLWYRPQVGKRKPASMLAHLHVVLIYYIGDDKAMDMSASLIAKTRRLQIGTPSCGDWVRHDKAPRILQTTIWESVNVEVHRQVAVQDTSI